MRAPLNLKQRSLDKELLDDEGIAFEDIRKNMQEIDAINQWLGGHKITLEGFKQILADKQNIHVCEIGCGNGNNLAVIHKWCKRKNISIKISGIDIKQECIAAARLNSKLTNAEWLASDYRLVQFNQKPDIIFSSLFCHHFSNKELVEQMEWMQQNSNLGFFINDLQRNRFAYYSIKIITQLFSRSYLVKNDAPLSVARGFHKKDWQQILQHAGLQKFSIKWKWAFRFLITYCQHAN